MIWAVEQPSQLSPIARTALQDPSNDLMLSAAAIWEVAIKVGLGKLTFSMPYDQWMDRAISDPGATIIPITVEYAAVQAGLANHHRDPFDRMLIAQGLRANLPLISRDLVFDRYGAARLW